MASILMAVSAILIVSHVAGRMSEGPESPPEQAYFFDLETGHLFHGPTGALPLIDAPSGAGQGALAVVYTCDACEDDQLQIGYIKKLSNRAQAAYTRSTELGAEAPSALVEMIDRETYVALPPEGSEEPRWVSVATSRGQEITQILLSSCGEKTRPKRCNPPQ